MSMVRSLTWVFASLLLLVACQSTEPTLKPLTSQDVILAFGDSLTYGTGSTGGASYPAALQKLIGFTVINAGEPGEETSGGRLRIKEALEKYHPTLVILCLGGNDMLRKRREELIIANLKAIIRDIQSVGAEVMLIAVPSATLTLSVPGFYKALGKEFQIIVDESTLRSLLKDPALKSDYIHLNNAGYRALAEAIARTLKQAHAIRSINQ